MQDSLKKLIFFFVKQRHPYYVNGGDIERYAMSCGYKASNAGRRCRELVRDDYFERRLGENRTVEYRYKLKTPVLLSREDEERRILMEAMR